MVDAKAAYTVSQVNRYIREMFDYDALLNGFFIEGEVSNFKAHVSGHWYFTLNDEKAAMRAVMFREAAEGASFAPANGDSVVCFGAVSVYEKAGQYQFYCETIEKLGAGGINRLFEETKARLAAEGIFDSSRKRLIPASPAVIAVVTSSAGAAIRDIVNVCKRRDPGVTLVLAPCSVQGETAAAEIAAALKLVNDWGGADVIICGRGGGGAEDLRAFNEETVARAVAESGIPVISAVGHETDVTIADFAADLRAPTPSAAAEIATRDAAADKAAALKLVKRLKRAAAASVSLRKGFARARADYLELYLERRIAAARQRLDSALSGLEKVSPLNVTRRGYGILSKAGRRVVSVSETRAGDTLDVALFDGRLSVIVKEKEPYAEKDQDVRGKRGRAGTAG
jgi:exodeoxyribonuclease VII large subunit